MICFEEVTKRYPDGTVALNNVSVTIPPHKLTAIIGPSGCGKTTLMKMINRLETPSSGELFIDEEPISQKDAVKLRRSIGYVIQRIGLIPHMTIAENIALVPDLLGWEQQQIDSRVNELLQLVKLDPATYKNRYPLELSGGQQQRIGVARALASDPNIILMDEPFSALDPISREQLQKELKSLQVKIQKTIVFVTHDMDEALEIADLIVVMRNGKIEQVSSPNELLSHQENAFVRSFIGVERIARKQTFKNKSLQELQMFFETESEGEVIRADACMTVEEANTLLIKHPECHLEVIDSESVYYVSHKTLLDAALKHQEGTTAYG
ncbi:ABC transporter ATP-binding protein [Virgibacillus sp. W0430]|uniref:ABC transporter ATP-binding protein n=1 Tax=Virgibacillus sp. W0430 TaxID=3391580 RepID=UPI003F4777DC